MLSGPIWGMKVHYGAYFYPVIGWSLVVTLHGAEPGASYKRMQLYWGDLLLAGEYSRIIKLNEASVFHCSPSWSHTVHYGWDVSRMSTKHCSALLPVPHQSLSLSVYFSSDYKAFQEASERFQPYIKFFATFSKSVSFAAQNECCECSYSRM